MSENLKDRIWLTAHIRMNTERRLRLTSRAINYIVIWYSTVLTCLTVYQLIAVKSTVRDVTSAALAIIILTLSVFIPSLNLDQQADRFRECYLKLQRLLDTVASENDLTTSYYDVLDAYPNHPPKDYTDFVVASKLRNQRISTLGDEILPTISMYISYWARRIFGFAILVVALFLPGLLYFLR